MGSDFVYVRVGCKAIEAQGFGMQIWLQTHGFLGGGEEERRIEFCLGFILHACALLPPLPRLTYESVYRNSFLDWLRVRRYVRAVPISCGGAFPVKIRSYLYLPMYSQRPN
jgi:hypothetical protein